MYYFATRCSLCCSIRLPISFCFCSLEDLLLADFEIWLTIEQRTRRLTKNIDLVEIE